LTALAVRVESDRNRPRKSLPQGKIDCPPIALKTCAAADSPALPFVVTLSNHEPRRPSRIVSYVAAPALARRGVLRYPPEQAAAEPGPAALRRARGPLPIGLRC